MERIKYLVLMDFNAILIRWHLAPTVFIVFVEIAFLVHLRVQPTTLCCQSVMLLKTTCAAIRSRVRVARIWPMDAMKPQTKSAKSVLMRASV
jgi:hypothetical protein